MSHKIGFWSVFALVIGSQIGSGVFLTPAELAPYGIYSLGGLAIASIGAIALALVFAQLCAWFPQTGGPHVYVEHAFGKTAAFFTGWTYWVISWVSSTVLIIGAIRYLTPFIGELPPTITIALQIALLAAITLLNFFGVQAAGRAEFILTVLKIAPLLTIPLLGLAYFSSNNFVVDTTVAHLSTTGLLSQAAVLSMWGFIGVESATTPAGSVENPTRTIPLAVITGTTCTALLYLLNSVGIMGVIPGSELMRSNAPYVDAVKYIIGGNWHLLISVLAAIICIGSLNAWMLTSGQIALGLAQDGLFPRWFGKKNSYDAPFWGLAASALGIIPFLLLSAQQGLAHQINVIINYSVTGFLFVYALSCLAFLKLLFKRAGSSSGKIVSLIYGLFACTFCCWTIAQSSLTSIAVASLFTLSGLPFYVHYRCKQQSFNHNQ